jgi:hypothetical protein
MAYELDALRAACSRSAAVLVNRETIDDAELEECAQLDDAISHAQRVLKSAVRNVMLARLTRHSSAEQ